MTETYAPEQIEAAIRDVSNRIANGVRICATRYEAYLKADREYDQQFAAAYLDANDKPAHERKYIAELETVNARQLRDQADAAYRYADRQAKALELELRALQSVGASIRTVFGVAGRGE